ncbi:MAG: hypothetical protein ACFCBU_08470 [Cyanophyceae cyanobacterium]
MTRLERLRKNFDLRSYEKSKELLIDAYCEEAVNPLKSLKIWKGAAISSDRAKGNSDYLIAERRDYLERLYLYVLEPKKDDFEKGLAQCLVEMYVCQWQNIRDSSKVDGFDVVTNAKTWQFYKLDVNGIVYESRPYTSDDPDQLLGVLNYVFRQCLLNLGTNELER